MLDEHWQNSVCVYVRMDVHQTLLMVCSSMILCLAKRCPTKCGLQLGFIDVVILRFIAEYEYASVQCIMYIMHAQQCFHPSNRDRRPTSASTLPLHCRVLVRETSLGEWRQHCFCIAVFWKIVLQEYRGVEQGLSSYLRTGSCRSILIEK